MQTNFETAVAVRDFSDTSDKSRKRKIGVAVVGVILLVAAGAAIGIYFGLYSSSSSSNGTYGKGAILNATLRASIGISTSLIRSTTTLPSSIDWRSNPYAMTPIKNQQQCGCCWAFSTSDAIEAAYGLSTQTTVQPVSIQQIISCDTGNGDAGCNGGDPAQALSGYLSKKALTSAHLYPFTDTTGTTSSCKTALVAEADSTLNWFPVQVDASNPVVYAVTPCSSSTCAYSSTNENSLMTALVKGPVSICVDASGWNNYVGGVVDGSGSDTGKTTCTGSGGSAADPSAIDHAVSVVGYNTANSKSYWIVRNQWGTSWGESGYIYLLRGQNTCCILCEAIQTNVKATIATATTTAAATTTATPTTAAKTTASSTTKSATTASSGSTTTASSGSTATTVAAVTTAKATTAAVSTTTTAAAATSSGSCSLSTVCTDPQSLVSAYCPCSTTSAAMDAASTYYDSYYGCGTDKKGKIWCCWYPPTDGAAGSLYYPQVEVTVSSSGATIGVGCLYYEYSLTSSTVTLISAPALS